MRCLVLRTAASAAAVHTAHGPSSSITRGQTRAVLAAHAQVLLLPPTNCRDVSTWRLAAGGLQRKWKGIKQRTAWRFKPLKDKNTLVVFSDDEQKEKTIHIKPPLNNYNDAMACHNVLASASAASLNGILGATSPQDSSEFVKTMTGFLLHASAPTMRAKVLDVITRTRLHEITIANRAVIIRAIQRCLLSPLVTNKPMLHTAASNVLLGTTGRDLTLLKDLVHASEEFYTDVRADASAEASHASAIVPAELPAADRSTAAEAEPPHAGDLSYLVYGNPNVTEVVQVMQHIAVEAVAVLNTQPPLVKVVSDIDDTLFPGWVDRRYPLHIPYPGVSDLFARISRSLALYDARAEKLPASITFLTARPRGWLSVGRYMTVQHLKSLGVPNATVLNGSVKGLVSSKKIATLKMDNFTRFASLYPECRFVFFGDSGQGDALLASKLLATFPDKVLATFIHDVTPAMATTGDGQDKATYRAAGVDFFSTYAGAALAAYHKRLIEKHDLVEIVARAESELDTLLFSGPNAEASKQARRSELESDAEQARSAVQQAT